MPNKMVMMIFFSLTLVHIDFSADNNNQIEKNAVTTKFLIMIMTQKMMYIHISK